MDFWMGALGLFLALTGASLVFFADEVAASFRRRSADDYFTNTEIGRYAGYAGIAVGVVTLAVAYF
jgi:hypothetical protein